MSNIFKKAAGLFVEFGDEKPTPSQSYEMPPPQPASSTPVAPSQPTHSSPPPARSVEQIVRESDGPNLDQITIQPEKAKSVTAPGGVPQFEEIYAQAGLPKSEFSAEQALEVMNSLPSELPLEMRRKTVQTTISAMGKALGVSTESVVADASRKIAAIAAYSDALTHQTELYVSSAEVEIENLEKKIADYRTKIASAKENLDKAVSHCNAETSRIDDVLEFFTLDIGSSKLAPPQ